MLKRYLAAGWPTGDGTWVRFRPEHQAWRAAYGDAPWFWEAGSGILQQNGRIIYLKDGGITELGAVIEPATYPSTGGYVEQARRARKKKKSTDYMDRRRRGHGSYGG